MTLSVDLNADMGEGFGPWPMGNDAALLQTVTSANIACGFHAGDPDTMARTMALAVENDVGIGAHPGFPDLQGFGRRRMHMPLPALQNAVRYQLGAAQAMARAAGAKLRHLKLHGALANMASEDEAMARACYEAALDVAPEIIIMVLAATPMEQAVRALGCNWVGEIFADRAYNDDPLCSLGGVMDDGAGQAAVDQCAIITESGAQIPTQIDTICLHGDTAEAVGIARAVRQHLTGAGITVEKF
ncbi:MAG: 5-oxoprolinase subunit PxpA [Pseudomonadota bacterium]